MSRQNGRERPTSINFGSNYARKPGTQHMTNRLNLGQDVDTMEIRSAGVFVTKVDKKRGVRHCHLYTWNHIHDVAIEDEKLTNEERLALGIEPEAPVEPELVAGVG